MTPQTRGPIVLLLQVLSVALAAVMLGCARLPAGDPIDTVKRHIEAMRSNDQVAWASTLTKDAETGLARENGGQFGVVSLAIHDAQVSDAETRRMKERYSGSELARNLGWSDAYIADNLVVVSARYTVDYDNTRVPFTEGTLTQDFILVRSDDRSEWLIWDAASPSN